MLYRPREIAFSGQATNKTVPFWSILKSINQREIDF